VANNGVWPPGALVNSPATIVTLTGTNFFPTSVASIGGTALTTTVLSATTMLVTIPASVMSTAGNLALVITTASAASPSASATFVVYGPGPQIWSVANSASYTASTVSPGGILTIYGINLGPASLVTFPGTDPIPTSLPVSGAATSIDIGGAAAPLLYSSATQVSCIVPYSLSSQSGKTVQLTLTYNSIASPAFTVNVVDADPGVFTVDASGVGQGAILNYNSISKDYTVNSSSNAAARGSTISIYITGFGLTACADLPLSTCVLNATEANLIAGNVTPAGTVTVTIDGQNVTPQGAAAPIGSVAGVLQINATVPAGAKPGNAVPVIVSLGSAKSQARVTMCVK
jgi:trimeric autotransporter adhesin